MAQVQDFWRPAACHASVWGDPSLGAGATGQPCVGTSLGR